ncbi:hypothetical protein IW262DRAFT_1300683 [Armillaria fumosa]|nr:hypothetical protein IW262DRAFT_1300683 [Armillaria fumosa]
MSHQYSSISHHHSDGECEEEFTGLELRRFLQRARYLNLDSADSLDAHDLVGQWLIHPKALTPYEHTILQPFQRDHNMCSLDQLITFREFAISRHPDEKKGLEDRALGVYECALDAAGDSKGLSLAIVCFFRIGAMLRDRYDRLGDAEDLNRAI